MAKNIIEFNIDGTSYTQRPYCTCSTAADTAAKVVTCADFNLVAGATVMVQFTNANTVDNPTLNVNNTGAKPIFYRGTRLSSFTFNWNWDAYDIIEFRYNGSRWDILNISNAKTATSLYKSEVIASSSSTNKDKWIKFATVDVSASGYNRCSGHLIFSDNENGNFFGILGLYITTAATISNESVSLRWISLDNILFKDSVAVVKVNDGIFDLYFKAAAHWSSPQVYYHGAHPQKITFNCGDASTYVDNITPLKVSSLDSQASNSDNALKLNGLDSSLYFKGTGVLESDDFNNKTTLGLYRYNGITGKNGPADADPYGNLMVLRSGTNDTLTQLYFNIYNNRIFARSGSVSQFINNDWNKLAFTSDIPTSLKNPNKLTLKVGNNTPIEYDGSSAKTVNIDFAHKQEFTIGANKYAKITGGGIFTAFISVGSTLGNARHMSCWSSYGSGQSMRTNIKHIINGTDIYIDESDTGPIIYIKGYSQQTVIHILCSLSSFTCEELSSLPANVSITNTNSNNYTLAVKSDIPTTLKNPYSLTIQGNGTSLGTYDGSSAKTVNITPSSIGALALTGGTLTGPLTISNNSLNITNEKPVVFTIPRCNENGGGWAVKQLIVNGHEDSGGNYPTIYSMGSYGQNNALNYIFIGANEYSSTKNLRIYPNGNVEAPTFTGNLTGNAAVASKLGSSTIGNSLTPIYISSGSPKQCSALADTLITYESVYNDYDAAAKLSPIQLSASNYHSANRLAFANPDGITIEYSTDGGTTWVDYGLSNNDKFRFITHVDGIYIYAGKKLSAKASKNDKLRITLHASNLGLYTRATNLLVNMSTNGSVCNKSNGGVDNCIKVDIERSNIGSESNFTSTASNIRLAGWSGWNNIPMNQISFGGGSTQTSNIGAIRLTFYSDGAGSSYSSGAHFYIQNLYLIGSTYWASPSTLAKTGHLYDYNYLQDMILPKDLVPRTHNTGQIGWGDKQWAAIYANGFYENGTQLVNKYAAKEHTHTKSGEGKIWLYPENGNEVNFGGTSTDSTVYFGYRTKDSKPIPTLFIFGSSTGTAQIKAAGFIKKDSTNSYVLLGGGGHKAISDFATASKLGSSTIGATDRPIYLSGGSPVQTTYRMAGTNEVATTAIDISSAINTGIWYVNGTSNIYSQADGVAIVNRYNDSWISQIYQDYRTGKLAVRGKNNGVWTEWKKIALTSDIPTSLPWSSITDKSETLLGYNLQERIEDLNLGTTNRFFRTGAAPSNAPGQNGYVVGLTMALNNDSDYRVQLAYDQSISRLSYRQQSGATSWGDWKKIALLTDIPTIPTIGNGTITIKQNGTSKGTFTVNQTGNTTIELTDTTGITSQDHYKTSVTAGTAGTSSATSGSTLAVPYVTVNANGHVTGYGTHTHTISGFLTSHQQIYNLTMQAGAFSAVTFDPNGAAKTVNIPTKTSHLTNDSGFLTSETYKGTVTKVSTGVGLTGGDITSTGTIKCKLNSETSLGTIGTTSKLYAVGVDANGKLCVNVPWTDTNTDTSTTYDGHYTPSGTAKTGTASGNTLSYGGAVVTGLTYDGKGHVTGFATSKLPSAITVDTSLSSTSTNPVQNKVINSALNNKMDKVTLATVATTGSYNNLTNKPTIPTTTSQLTNNSGFVDDKIKTPAITSFTTWDGVTKFGLRAWSNNATSRQTDYGIALDFAGDNGGYNWRNRLAFATEGKGIYYYYATNNNTLNYGGRLITTKGDYTLNGNLTANAFYISSDERLKTFGDDIKVDFDELAKLRKSHFVFNDNPTKQEIGVSAQEVQKIYPEIVNETEEGTLSVDYSKLAVVALAAIDKLNQRVQELENKLAKYE